MTYDNEKALLRPLKALGEVVVGENNVQNIGMLR
jgi:hypothetical protein